MTPGAEMTTSADGGPGSPTLRVTVGTDDGAVLPVQVRRPTMVVAASGRTGEPITVDPGAYLVTTTLPDGQELLAPVEVGPGQARTVELRPDAGPEPGPGSRSAGRRRASHRTVRLRLLAGDPFDPPLRTVGAARVRFPGADEAEPRRALDGLPPLPPPAVPDSRPDPDRFAMELRLPDGDPGRPVAWLRLTAPPDRVLLTAVPALPGGACTLVLARPPGRGRFTVDFHLPDPELDALLHYRQIGNAPQARGLLDADLLARVGGSPVYRSMVGYAALRLGGPDVSGLAQDWFTPADRVLPDAWICEGERYARRGEHDRARAAFVQALRRGLPMFGNGLGYLSSRIPQYLRTGQYLRADGGDLAGLWSRVVPFVRAADLKPAVLSLRADVLPYRDRGTGTPVTG